MAEKNRSGRVDAEIAEGDRDAAANTATKDRNAGILQAAIGAGATVASSAPNDRDAQAQASARNDKFRTSVANAVMDAGASAAKTGQSESGPPEWLRRAMDPGTTLGNTLASHMHQASANEKIQNEARIAAARNSAEQFAAPKAMWAEQNVPFARTVADALRSQNAPAPAPRPPIQMQREFSNDAERDAYLARLREGGQ